jgi:cytochrome c-type biogenesis protein CcsB
MDYFIYRLIAVGLLLLTITILSGAIWAEEAWSAFWTWDPKEVWALITWILYSVYLHLRLGRKKTGTFMAWYAVIAVPVVLFTFIGVNTLMPGLHSYGAVLRGILM